MDRGLSVYLDAVRLMAALAVLVGHMDQDGLYADWLLVGRFSHEAVVVFFVLSGLVIAQATPTTQRDWRHYVSARAARIYSVALPAIALSFVVKGLATELVPDQLGSDFWSVDWRWANLINSALFLNESWGMTTALPWNVPYWSLCYEVWYYVIFGLAVFVPARRACVAAVSLACLIAGPAILLLFPLWLLGLLLARHGHRWIPAPGRAAVLFLVTVLAMTLLHRSGLAQLVQKTLYEQVPGYWRLQSSQRFVTDYLWGLLVALNFIALRGLSPVLRSWLMRWAPWVQRCAAFTFSLYLFHRPFTQLAGSLWPNQAQNRAVSLAWLVVVITLCVLLGSLTEARKATWRRWIRRRLGPT